MKKFFLICICATLLTSLAGTVFAQDSAYHPVLSDNFIFSAGAFRSDNALKIRADGTLDIGDNIDFGESVGVDRSSTLAYVQLRWNFGSERKWSLAGQYFASDTSGDATLKEDVDWQDIKFREGTFVDGGIKFEVARLFLSRSFVKNEQHDFGAGLGIHNLDLSAYIGGEIMINDDTTGYRRENASTSQLLPNLGAWYNFSPASRWLLHGRLDWISADLGKVDGTLWNTNVGVNFQAWRHVGFDLSYQYFNLDFVVDKGDWRGGADITYSGPVISVTVNW